LKLLDLDRSTNKLFDERVERQFSVETLNAMLSSKSDLPNRRTTRDSDAINFIFKVCRRSRYTGINTKLHPHINTPIRKCQLLKRVRATRYTGDIYIRNVRMLALRASKYVPDIARGWQSVWRSMPIVSRRFQEEARSLRTL